MIEERQIKMRFGIMEMQLAKLVPADVSPKKAVDHILSFDHSELVREIAEAGFNLIELGGDLSLFFPHAYEEKSINKLKQLKKELGLSYTVHLPLWSVEPSTPLEPVRYGSADAIMDIIDAVEALEPEVYVLHATGALAAEFYRMSIPETAKSLVLKQFQGNAISSIKMILEETGLPSRKLAIETIEFPFDLTLEMADLLNLSICLDTGHVLAGFSGSLSMEDALSACLPRLAEVHLHDSPDFMKTGELGYGKDHQPLGTGDLNVKEFLKALTEGGFSGPIIFELTVDEAKDSLDYLKKIGVTV
jgi:sugar phosphate isomerase/epimerase